MVKRRPTKTASIWYRSTLKALEPPSEVFVSEHAVPDPEVFGVARTRAAFDAIRRAARGMGLVLGVPVRTPRKQPTFFVWGDEAEQAIDAAMALEPAQPPPYEDGAWPTGFVAWSDPVRATFLVVIADPDCNYANDIIAWGEEAEHCLVAVEKALDDDALWE